MEKYHFDRKIVSLELMTFSLNVGGYAPEYANKYKYTYLAVFNNKNWIPIQYGQVKGRKVRFTAMGRDCMYMPVFYDNNQVVPFSGPFTFH